MKDLIMRSIAQTIRILPQISTSSALALLEAFTIGKVRPANGIDRTGQLPLHFSVRKDGSWIFNLLGAMSLENAHQLLQGFKKYFCLKSFFNKILILFPLKWPHPVEGGGGKGCHKGGDKWCLYLADDP